MSIVHVIPVVKHLCPRRVTPRWAVVPLVLLFLGLLATRPALSQSPPERGTIRVLVSSNLNADPPRDYVSIIVAGQQDKALLMELAQRLGKVAGDQPTFFAYERGTPPLSDALGLSFTLRVMPRDGRTLPTNALLEAFAPYASHLQVMYQIEGPFSYNADWEVTNQDVSFKITKVFEAPASTNPPFVIYDTEARITNPELTSASLSDYLAAQHGKKRPRKGTLYLLLGLAVVIGISGGMLIAQLLKQYKTEETINMATSGGVQRHERSDNDA